MLQHHQCHPYLLANLLLLLLYALHPYLQVAVPFDQEVHPFVVSVHELPLSSVAPLFPFPHLVLAVLDQIDQLQQMHQCFLKSLRRSYLQQQLLHQSRYAQLVQGCLMKFRLRDLSLMLFLHQPHLVWILHPQGRLIWVWCLWGILVRVLQVQKLMVVVFL